MCKSYRLSTTIYYLLSPIKHHMFNTLPSPQNSCESGVEICLSKTHKFQHFANYCQEYRWLLAIDTQICQQIWQQNCQLITSLKGPDGFLLGFQYFSHSHLNFVSCFFFGSPTTTIHCSECTNTQLSKLMQRLWSDDKNLTEIRGDIWWNKGYHFLLYAMNVPEENRRTRYLYVYSRALDAAQFQIVSSAIKQFAMIYNWI